MGLLIVLSLLLSGIMLAPAADSEGVGITINAPVVSHLPIRIDSNADFPGIASAGDGSALTPWIIENLDINGTSDGYCIYVGNTTEYFTIKNCSLYGVPDYAGDAALELHNADNCNITNLSITNNVACGIDIYSSSNVLISNCSISNNEGDGISTRSSSIIVQNNSIVNNGMGIMSWTPYGEYYDNNTLVNNEISIAGDQDDWCSYNISDSNTFNGKSVLYFTNSANFTVPTNAGQVILANCTYVNVTGLSQDSTVTLGYSNFINVSDCVLSGGGFGIYMRNSNNNTIANNQIHSVKFAGVRTTGDCDNTTISNNDIFNIIHPDGAGIFLVSSDQNIIFENKIETNSTYGIRLASACDSNRIYHNSLSNNLIPAMDDGVNDWDDSYPSGGNYWSDYTGDDFYMGNNQDTWGKDGIGDSPYSTGNGNFDNYPLMYPYDLFLFADFIPPIALNYTPNGTEIPLNAIIQIAWNETMNWTSVEGAFNYTDGVTNYSSANGTWDHNSTTNNSTFIPDDDFAYETQYFVTVNITATDIIGNMLDQDGNGTGGYWPEDVLEWNFTTTDESPYVVSTNPANSQVDVDPNTPIIITFSEPMNQSSVEEAFSYTNDTLTFTIGNGTQVWNGDRTMITFYPDPALELNQTYTFNLNGSMVRDIGGKIIGSNYTWSFTTWLEPPPPHVIDTYPPSGAFNVPVNTHISLEFDLSMIPETVQDAFSYTDGTDIWHADDGIVDWYSENILFTFQPNELLNYDSTYTVLLGTNATSVHGKTLDGNNNGISEPNDGFIFTFTTGLEPPAIESHYPAAGQSEVSTSLPAIYVNFTKPMDVTSVKNAISISPYLDYAATTANQRNFTLALNDELLEGASYRVTIMDTALDLVGTKLDGNGDGDPGDRFTFTFATEGVIIPEELTIISVFPIRNSTIPIDPFYVEISFSHEMNRTSVQDAFSFGNSTAELNGTFIWISTGDAVRFVPDNPLEYNDTYFVSVAGTARSIDGLFLGSTESWQYTTEAEEVPASLGDLLLYAAIIILLVLTIMLYMANRSLRMDLRKNRVKLKRAMKKYDFTEDDLKKKKPEKVEAPQQEDMPEIEESPDEAIPEEMEPPEPEPVEPEKVG